MTYSEKTNTVGLEGITHLLDLVYHTEYVDKPIGLLIISDPGAGKSMIMLHYKYEKSIITNDLTGRGLQDLIIKFHKEPRGFIVIPDLLKVLARKQSAENFLYLQGILLEEGVQKIVMFGTDIDFNPPLHYGLIAACTTMTYKKHKKMFEDSGFLSRNLVANYSYTTEISNKVMERIIRREKPTEYIVDRPEGIIIPETSHDIEEGIRELANLLGTSREDKFGFRAMKQIIALVLAQAVIDRVDKVRMEQLNKVACILPYLMGHSSSVLKDDNGKPIQLQPASDNDYLAMRNLTLEEKHKIDLDYSVDRLVTMNVLERTTDGYVKIRRQNESI